MESITLNKSIRRSILHLKFGFMMFNIRNVKECKNNSACISLKRLIYSTLQHHARRLAGDLHGKIGAAIPGVDLAHAGEIQPGDGSFDGGDIL